MPLHRVHADLLTKRVLDFVNTPKANKNKLFSLLSILFMQRAPVSLINKP